MKRNATRPRIDVRYVKFTPAEMAYDAPADVSDPKRFPTLARGRAEWQRFLSFKRGYVKLDPDLCEFFKNDQAVNDTLRKAVEFMRLSEAVKRRKRPA